LIQVLRVPVPPDLLRKMTNEERTFLLLMGYAENQISIMYKVLRFSTNFESENKIEQLASANQTQVMLRLLIGIIYEAWIQLVNERFLQRSNITIKLTQKGEAAVAELRAHLSTSALLGKIRNSFAFHYPDDQYMNQAFKLASEDHALKDEWNWYLSDARTNTSYFVSEMVFLHAVMKAAEVSTLEEAQHKLMQEVLKIHGLLCDLFDDIGNRFMEKYFSKPLDGFRATITEAPSLYEFALPFYAFVSEADGRKIVESDKTTADT
jgi:hypothetical protein